MYDMPLNGDAVLVENGAVTRVNRIARAIERTKTLADEYNKNGLSVQLIKDAIDIAEGRRVALFGERAFEGGKNIGFSGRYSEKFNRPDGKKSPFRREAGGSYAGVLTGERRGEKKTSKTGREYIRPFVKLSMATKLRIARFLGIEEAYKRGVKRKKIAQYGSDSGLSFGSKQERYRDASGNLTARHRLGSWDDRGALGDKADKVYRKTKRDAREDLRTGKIDRAGYEMKLLEARALRADVQAAKARREAEDGLGKYMGIADVSAFDVSRGFRHAVGKGAADAKEKRQWGPEGKIEIQAKTAQGKSVKRTVSQVLGMPTMYTKESVSAAREKYVAAGGKIKANPFSGLGDLALVSNPGSGIALLDSVEGFVAKVPGGEYVAPLVAPLALGAVGFGAHFVLVPRLRPYLPAGVLQDWAATVIGAAGAVASLVVYKMTDNQATRNAALAVGGTVAATGIILDLNKKYGGNLGGDDYGVSPVPGDLGAVALENPSFGAVALENPGMFGAVALENPGMFGDGMAYQLSPVGFGFDGEVSALQNAYGRASAADAYYSGPDFDSAEGEALLSGAGEFGRAAGPVPRLAAGQRKHHSEFAGRRFHRWGWLIKLVGFQNAQQIAALPPEERLKVIDSLRKQALQTYQQYLASHKVSESLPAGVAAGGPLAPAAAPGVGDAFGYGALAVSDY